MKIPIFFYPLLILNLIRYNPIKIISVIILVLININSDYFTKPSYIKTPIIKEIKYRYNYLYVYESIHNDDISYEVKNFNKKQPVVNGHLIEKDKSSLYHLFVIVDGILFTLFIIILSFNGFNLSKVRMRTISRFITCELEGDKYYYFFNDRLLDKTESRLEYSGIRLVNKLNIDSLSDIRVCPIYKTKTKNREEKLNEILK